MRKKILSITVLLSGVFLAAQASSSDYFAGPLSTWIHLKTEYGAVGDGIADDTQPLQDALDYLRAAGRTRSILYIPAGTYRITQTLDFSRNSNQQPMAVGIVGEDPATTSIVWDGVSDGVMVAYNPWYSRIARITFDGSGHAGTALQAGNSFSSMCEFSDLVFKDVDYGFEAGLGNAGIAEQTFKRCHFLRCSKAGIRVNDWNSLDIWIWHSQFTDCAVGVTNHPGSGHFHVFESLFKRSTTADILIGNTSFFDIRDNVSIRSKTFFSSITIGAACSLILQRNRIIEPLDGTAGSFNSAGPVFLLDNSVQSADGFSGPVFTTGTFCSVVSVGNRYTVDNAEAFYSRHISLDNIVVDNSEIADTIPSLPATPQRLASEIFDVPLDATSGDIQQIIDSASVYGGDKPVVHFLHQQYSIDKTLTIPSQSDIIVTGDGIQWGTTQLAWSGSNAGPLFHVLPGARVHINELAIHGGDKVDAFLIDNADRSGDRVLLDQTGCSFVQDDGYDIRGLDNTKVLLAGSGSSNCHVGLMVRGRGDSSPVGAGVVEYCGSSSANYYNFGVADNGRLLVRNHWYDNPPDNLPYYASFTDVRGTFTLHNAWIYHRRTTPAGITIQDFSGKLAFLGASFYSSGGDETLPFFEVVGDNPDARILALGLNGPPDYFTMPTTVAHAARLMSYEAVDGGGQVAIDDIGNILDTTFILSMLEQTRSLPPLSSTVPSASASDIVLSRVFIEHVSNGIVVQKASGSVASRQSVPTGNIPIAAHSSLYAKRCGRGMIIGWKGYHGSPGSVKLFSLCGKLVATLRIPASRSESGTIFWNGENASGAPVRAGPVVAVYSTGKADSPRTMVRLVGM